MNSPLPEVAVFDFDKTLTKEDTFRLFLTAMSGHWRVYEAAIRHMPGLLRGLGDSGVEMRRRNASWYGCYEACRRLSTSGRPTNSRIE